MRQAEASAAPAARAPAKLLVRKAATSRGWTRCPGHPEDGPPDAGTPSSPCFGQGPPGRDLPCLGLVATSPCPGTFSSPQLLAVSPASPTLVSLSWLRPAHSSHLRQAGAAPGAACPNTPRTTCPAPSHAIKHRCLLLPAEAFEGEKYPFPTQKTRSQEEKGAQGVLTSARTNPSASTQWL